MTKKINYLMVGTGGVGGNIAGFLALQGSNKIASRQMSVLQDVENRKLLR
ncbi:MAG: hypothetical protein LBL24_11370 [Bacteroidales bacterium]|jgi:hypothetical protein|nr:hypothetical protein [Bacteroidales bacterium]